MIVPKKVGLNSANLRMRPWSKYLSLFLLTIQQSIAYRKTTILTIMANLVWVIIPYSLWKYVYSTNAEVGTFSWAQMRTYILLSYLLNTLMMFYTEAQITSSIRSGHIASELVRPIHYMNARLAETGGRVAIEALLTVPIALMLGVFVLNILPPNGPLIMGLFLVSALSGLLIKFLISYITGLLSFWTVNAVGLLWARAAITNIFSGALIPIQFLPGILKDLAFILPFQAIINTPISIYLGNVDGRTLYFLLGVQFLWIVILWVLASLLWKPSLRVVTIQGG